MKHEREERDDDDSAAQTCQGAEESGEQRCAPDDRCELEGVQGRLIIFLRSIIFLQGMPDDFIIAPKSSSVAGRPEGTLLHGIEFAAAVK